MPGLWRKDVAIGLTAFAAVTGPILLSFAAIQPLADNLVLDPLPMFVLAMVLGTLYYRTHRILPSIVLHAAFNMTGVFLALATAKATFLEAASCRFQRGKMPRLHMQRLAGQRHHREVAARRQ